MEVLRNIPKICAMYDDGHVAMLGDFWMVRHNLPVKILLDVRDEIKRWRRLGVVRVEMLSGNHDAITLEHGRNALEVFDGLEDFVHVHSEPEWTEHGFWLPFRPSHDVIRQALQKAIANPAGPPTLYAHIGLLGAWMNSLKKDEDGFSASELVAMGWKRVLCGHYHRHHSVMKGVSYIGSPYQVSYAEAGQPKGVVRWDGLTAEFIEWDIGPRHHKVVFDVDHPEALAIPSIRPTDKLWVVVKGQLAAAAKDVVSANLKAIGIEPSRIEMDFQPTESAARIELKAGESRKDTAFRFIEAQDIPPEYRSMLRETFNRVVTP